MRSASPAASSPTPDGNEELIFEGRFRPNRSGRRARCNARPHSNSFPALNPVADRVRRLVERHCRRVRILARRMRRRRIDPDRRRQISPPAALKRGGVGRRGERRGHGCGSNAAHYKSFQHRDLFLGSWIGVPNGDAGSSRSESGRGSPIPDIRRRPKAAEISCARRCDRRARLRRHRHPTGTTNSSSKAIAGRGNRDPAPR